MDTSEKDSLKFKMLRVIRQNHPLRVKWDLFVMILAVFNSIVIPIDIAFRPLNFQNQILVSVNYVVDCMFLLDIIFNFRTTFHNQLTGDEVINPKQIAKAYASSTRFWIDVLSTVPFDLIMGSFLKTSNSNNYQLL